MRYLVLMLALAGVLAMPASAGYIGVGIDPDSLGANADSAVGKTGSAALVDTTDAIYIGDYSWVRPIMSAYCDTVTIICQTSRDGVNWTTKDSTATASAIATKVLYDSTYVRGGYFAAKTPFIPAPWIRYLIRDLSSGSQASPSGIKKFRFQLLGGR
jgi:hypothetical protein